MEAWLGFISDEKPGLCTHEMYCIFGVQKVPGGRRNFLFLVVVGGGGGDVER